MRYTIKKENKMTKNKKTEINTTGANGTFNFILCNLLKRTKCVHSHEKHVSDSFYFLHSSMQFWKVARHSQKASSSDVQKE